MLRFFLFLYLLCPAQKVLFTFLVERLVFYKDQDRKGYRDNSDRNGGIDYRIVVSIANISPLKLL